MTEKTISTQSIQLLVGLGNIGATYAATRHNIGWWLLDAWAQSKGITWQHNNRFMGDVTRLDKQGQSLYLLKPSTYMNRSGTSVQAIANFYKISPARILVIHDELDFPCGVAQYKYGGSPAGHNGLKSLDACLQTQAYWRLRIGIDHPRRSLLPTIQAQSVADYVLHSPTLEQKNILTLCLDTLLTTLESKLLQPKVEKIHI